MKTLRTRSVESHEGCPREELSLRLKGYHYILLQFLKARYVFFEDERRVKSLASST